MRFSVLQFNTWLLALPFFDWSADLEARKCAMPTPLAATGADVISLQEVWRNKDKLFLERALRPLGYSHFLYTEHRFGLGDGMFLASKHPIRRVVVGRPFRVVTRFIELFPAKRVVAAAIDLPGVGEVDFFQTHLGSVLFDAKAKAPDAKSRKKLIMQLLDVAEFIRAHRRSDFAILAGDLNFHYQAHEGDDGYGARYSNEYVRFLEVLAATGLNFENSFLVANGVGADAPAEPTYSQSNPYARASFTANPEETLDYILYAPSSGWRARASKVVFRERVSERVPALSDHYGIFSEFAFSSPEKR